MLSDLRTKALNLINLWVPGEGVKSNDPKSNFNKITNLNHADLMDEWQAKFNAGRKDFTTCCNAFVIWYLNKMELPWQLVFELNSEKIKRYLEGKSKGFAWIDPLAPNAPLVPSLGDPFVGQGQHVGIALDCDLFWGYDNIEIQVPIWHTVEGGQNRVKFGPPEVDQETGNMVRKIDRTNSFDRVKRMTYPDSKGDPKPLKSYTRNLLRGWVDIDLFHYGEKGAPDLKTNAETEARNRPWISGDGKVAHPDSPDGSGGPGRSCFSGILPEDPFNRGQLPHPRSPEARLVDPLKVSRFRKDYDMS